MGLAQEFWPMPDTIKAKDSTAIAETLENYFLSGWMSQVTGSFTGVVKCPFFCVYWTSPHSSHYRPYT